MITTEHQVSELISMYKKMASIYEVGTNSKSATISNYVSKNNFEKALKTLILKKVLVWGCQNGNWPIFLAKLGFDVTIVDRNTDLLKFIEDDIAESDLSIKTIVYKLAKTDIPDQEFDLVVAENGIISTSSNPVEMLEEFKRVTKSGGYIWIDYLNLLGWTMLQRNTETRMLLTRKEEEIIYLGKTENPVTLFSPKKIRYLLYDAGFIELNEFGNGILTNPLMDEDEIPDFDMEEIKKTELTLSRNYNLTGSAFHIQVLAQKIIH